MQPTLENGIQFANDLQKHPRNVLMVIEEGILKNTSFQNELSKGALFEPYNFKSECLFSLGNINWND